MHKSAHRPGVVCAILLTCRFRQSALLRRLYPQGANDRRSMPLNGRNGGQHNRSARRARPFPRISPAPRSAQRERGRSSGEHRAGSPGPVFNPWWPKLNFAVCLIHFGGCNSADVSHLFVCEASSACRAFPRRAILSRESRSSPGGRFSAFARRRLAASLSRNDSRYLKRRRCMVWLP
jgi:hypothetical protein